MTRVVLLDAGPLGLLAHPRLGGPVESWVSTLLTSAVDVAVPEIAVYEVRRELLRLELGAAVQRLDRFAATLRYEPITTNIMMRATALWAEARRRGRPTAADKALDADVILAATGLDMIECGDDVVVATTNVGHLRRFVEARLWQDIAP